MTRQELTLFSFGLVFGPGLFALSSLYWVGEGQYGITGSVLLVLGSVFWIVAFQGIFRLLATRMPRYAAWGQLVATYGAVCGGVGFALHGMFMSLHGISHGAGLQALGDHPVVANVIFWIGGPAFPVSLLVLGIVLIRTKILPVWAGALLSLGGALFPVARIPRIDLLAHAVDLLMLVPAWYLAWRVNRERTAQQV